MNKFKLASAAAIAVMTAAPAMAADLAVKAPSTFVERFTWTGCYLGGHIGGGFAHNDITDPVQLVQDQPLFFGPGATAGVTTVSPSSSGLVIGGQIGCDYQFAPNWVIGIEGAASGATISGDTTVGLPLSPTGETALVSAKTDFLGSVTGRLGFTVDRVLFYGKAGVAWAGGKYIDTGTLLGTTFRFEGPETRTGWTAGAGAEWAFSPHWSTFIEYDYYGFGSRDTLMSDPVNALSGPVNTKLNVQVVKAGVNFHMWSGGL